MMVLKSVLNFVKLLAECRRAKSAIIFSGLISFRKYSASFTNTLKSLLLSFSRIWSNSRWIFRLSGVLLLSMSARNTLISDVIAADAFFCSCLVPHLSIQL